MINVGVCKELDEWDSCGKDCMWNPSTCNCQCDKACKNVEYLHIKDFLYEKRLIGNLVLECEDEVLNTTEAYTNE